MAVTDIGELFFPGTQAEPKDLLGSIVKVLSLRVPRFRGAPGAVAPQALIEAQPASPLAQLITESILRNVLQQAPEARALEQVIGLLAGVPTGAAPMTAVPERLPTEPPLPRVGVIQAPAPEPPPLFEPNLREQPRRRRREIA